jgi:uncharacterized protein with ParB-like and HNH nuclease domain
VPAKPKYVVPEMVIDEDGVEDLDEAAEVIPYNYEITAYGADYPVDGLVQRLESGDIVVPSYDPEVAGTTGEVEGFQRRFMWTKPQIDRFIESLLLGLPVPGIFLVRESNNVLLVLDGQQRLRTLQAFYGGMLREKAFKLEAVQERFVGLTYKDLDDDDRRRINDSIIHATIMRQDTPTADQSSVYTLFERLNTGGTNLQPQEIRVALYRGPFAGVLRDLNEYSDWRSVYGNRSERLKDQELILRFFALLYAAEKYERPMKGFLNSYMATNRKIKKKEAEEFGEIFKTTTSLLHEAVGAELFRLRRALNAAVFDAVMTGVAHRLSTGKPVTSTAGVKTAYDRLLQNKAFVETVERATADEESVRTRLKLAKAAFSKVK